MRQRERERLATAARLARVLDVSERSVYRMAQRGEIPFFRVASRGVRFSIPEVIEALRRPVSHSEETK